MDVGHQSSILCLLYRISQIFTHSSKHYMRLGAYFLIDKGGSCSLTSFSRFLAHSKTKKFRPARLQPNFTAIILLVHHFSFLCFARAIHCCCRHNIRTWLSVVNSAKPISFSHLSQSSTLALGLFQNVCPLYSYRDVQGGLQEVVKLWVPLSMRVEIGRELLYYAERESIRPSR